MKIAIGFSKRRKFNPMSWLIQKCESTPFSHAYVRIPDKTTGKVLIFEATGTGVYFKGLEFFLEKSEIVEEYWFFLTPDEYKDGMSFAIDALGKKYGKMQLLGLALVRFLKLFGIRIRNPLSNGSRQYVCTELAGRFLVEVATRSSR